MTKSHGGKAQQTRQYILEKAAPVFNKRGYAGTSLSDITQATGLTKGAIYCNFKNKDELALQSFEYNLGRLRECIMREMQGRKSNVEKLLSYPRAYRKAYDELADQGGCPIVNTAVEADDTHRELHRVVLEAIDRWRDALMLLINRGRDNGEIKAGVDSARIAEIIISLVEGGSAMAAATGRKSFMMHALDQVENMIETIRE